MKTMMLMFMVVDIAGIIGWVTTNGGQVIMGILSILGGFSILAKLTPTKADDKIIDTILSVIHTLGLTKNTSGK